MRDAYKRRPQDFKRRVIKRINIREKLFEMEDYYLNMIKPEEFGKRYYNLQKHWRHWSEKEQSRLSIGQKISLSPNRRENISKANKGKKRTEEQKEKYSTHSIKVQKERIENGTHNFLHQSEISSKRAQERIKTGTHNFLDKEKAKERAQKRVKNGTHNFLGKREPIKCPHCNKQGGGGSMKRWHFDNCSTIKF